ncbi:hypothetical protein F53441_1120 [Fusarium austroafricanum]|uniref:Uncharacterized protein n=1 Tax=Fusarium austroafricanum TaxID=2364996 RepID=A0A8H4KWX5_9HYPO|nr:hypothetical protein F53441_1120 [Fusarium austroafricanum]
MRGFIPLLLALSASYTTVTALPQPRIVHRQAAAKPKYSVVPLEPGDDDPASDDGGGNGNGGSGKGSGGDNGDKDGDGIVTVIRTVTRKPITKIVTQTEKPSIITAPGKTVTKAVPTTVSVINLGDEPATETVTISHPSSKPKAPKKTTTTQKSNTPTDESKPTAQNTSEALSSTAAPGVTAQPEPEPQPKPQPKPEPKPESSTIVESPQTTETPSTTCITDSLSPVETVAQPPPASENSAVGSNPTTLLTLTSQGAGAPEETAVPGPDSPVAPIPSQETFVDGSATQDEPQYTATVPYVPPVAPTTPITFTTTTTTSDSGHGTPEPSSLSKTQDNGAWHTSYPAWNGTVLAI